MPKTLPEDRYRAPALDKGLDILELLSHQPKGMTRGEIVKAMDRSPSEIYRMIERLVMREYLFRSIEGDRYALTMKLFLLGSQYPPQRRMVTQAQPLMDQFADDTHQSIHLAAPDRGSVVVVAQASPRASWEFRLRIGAKLDLVGTGSGRTFLAFQSNEKRIELLSYVREASEIGADTIIEVDVEIKKIHEIGHRIGRSKQLLGVTDISAPILAPDGTAIAVLTCPYIERVDGNTGASTEAALSHLQLLAGQLSIS